MSDELQYHIKLSKEQGARYALIPGDPGRVEKIAGYLDSPRQIQYNREYNTFEGYLEGERVLVVSTGIGGPSAAICIEELSNIGVDTIIRIGTCGGMALCVDPGDVVIASGAIRLDGTSKEYMPIEFPAVADFGVTAELANAARSLGQKYHVGVVQSKDSFYGQHSPESMPTSDELSYKWRAWMRGGCLASEMESSTLFIVSAVRNLRSGALFHCVWNQEQAGCGMPVQRTHDTSAVIKIAVEAMRSIILKDKKL